MVGLEESMRQVKESMRHHDYAQEAHEQSQKLHERILNDYADMMPRPDERRRRRRDHDIDRGRESDRTRRHDSLRFRFKSDPKDPSCSKKRTRNLRHKHAEPTSDSSAINCKMCIIRAVISSVTQCCNFEPPCLGNQTQSQLTDICFGPHKQRVFGYHVLALNCSARLP